MYANAHTYCAPNVQCFTSVTTESDNNSPILDNVLKINDTVWGPFQHRCYGFRDGKCILFYSSTILKYRFEVYVILHLCPPIQGTLYFYSNKLHTKYLSFYSTIFIHNTYQYQYVQLLLRSYKLNLKISLYLSFS